MNELKSIGTIHSPFREQAGTPIQPGWGNKPGEGEVELFEEFTEGLADIEGFERIWLIYRLDRAAPAKLKVIPYRDTMERGIFATRSPSRPNAIGLSCVKLLGVEGCRLRVAELDILDGTPLLDIKPYAPRFDAWPEARAGWLDDSGSGRENADDRFEE
jgi:tRNA (adenine37-N6)-methyltransferase